MKFIFGILLFLISLNVHSGEILKIFGDGVFGTRWGASLEEVTALFPGGKVEKYGDIVQFVIKDGRSILGIKRSKNDLIRFGFDSEGRLVGVVAYFDGDDFANVLSKLTTHFGQPTQSQPGIFVTVQWPQDENILMSMALIPSGFTNDTGLTISNTGLIKPETSKEDLGFE